VGYSCILFANALRESGGRRYYTLERNPEFAAVIGSLVDLAGLSDIVKVIVGPSDAGIRRLHEEKLLQRVDMMFLDHYKPAYTSDLKLCEELGLIVEGTVLAADNVIKPGNPPYLEYVRSSVEAKIGRAGANGTKARNGTTDGFDERWAKQYEKREGEEHLNGTITGDPHLVYESRLVESFEPTGVPVSVLHIGDRMWLTTGFCRMELRLQSVLDDNEAEALIQQFSGRTDLVAPPNFLNL
jgi:catechol O-methyltransferase